MPLDLPINYANEKLPPVPEELVFWLKQVYPNRLPDIGEDLDSIRIKQGQQSEVQTLISINEENKENVYGNETS